MCTTHGTHKNSLAQKCRYAINLLQTDILYAHLLQITIYIYILGKLSYNTLLILRFTMVNKMMSTDNLLLLNLLLLILNLRGDVCYIIHKIIIFFCRRYIVNISIYFHGCDKDLTQCSNEIRYY